MMIPEFLFGAEMKVRSRARRFVKEMKEGRVFEGPFLDSRTTEGLLLIDRVPFSGTAQCFRLYGPLEVVVTDVPRMLEVQPLLFDTFRRSAWGVLGLMG